MTVQCKMKFSMAIFKWCCQTHGRIGNEQGCLQGARERIVELEAALTASPRLLAACKAMLDAWDGYEMLAALDSNVRQEAEAAIAEAEGKGN